MPNPYVRPANPRRWELHKSDFGIQRPESIALPPRTTRANRPLPADVDLHKASRRFVFSISNFAAPTAPAFHADEQYRVVASCDAIGAMQGNSISTARESIRCRG